MTLTLIKVAEDGEIEVGATRGTLGEFENCVFCQEPTDVRVDTPADQRRNYFRDAGQACQSCYGDAHRSPQAQRQKEMHERCFRGLHPVDGVYELS